MDTVIDLSNVDARSFFLRGGSYCNFNLPLYFDFQPLLDKLSLSDEIPKSLSKDNIYTNRFKKFEQGDINYLMYTNKDGKLAWRPLELINPVAYVYIVNIITDGKNWGQIQARFKSFQKNKNIKCCSLPIVKNNSPNKGETIKGWLKVLKKSP